MKVNAIKLIELQDQYIDKNGQFPYIHSFKSHIRFRLRSKLTFDHTPFLLVEKLEAFDYLLPLKEHVDLDTPNIDENFIVLRGEMTKDGAWIAQLPQLVPGIISFQLVFTKSGSNLTVRRGSHDIILLCQMKIQLRKLRKMTVFPRCIGRHTQWQNFFLSQKQIGYNAFHLAPIQQTGSSNSYYSLKDHLQLSNQLFNGTKQQKNAQLLTILTNLKSKGLTFFIDIILNHTSFDSEWIKDSPDAVFTVDNTPMLYTAFLVDQVIYEWGEEVKDMMSFGVEPTKDILVQIQQNLLNRLTHLKLHEFFQLSDQLQSLLLFTVSPRKPSENIFAKDPIESIQQFLLSNCTCPNNQRKGITVKDLNVWTSLNIAYDVADLKIAISTYNQNWRQKLETVWVPEIVKNTIDGVKYHYFDNNFRRFDDPYPLVNKYFSRVEGTSGEFFALNNGWVGGADSRQIFVLSKQYYYLRRRVHSWGDLLRIRYGDCPSDSPKAWNHMLKYVRQMANYFQGFRMDNLHGTQISVAKYMIKEARKVNPNLVIFAQLFTQSDEQTAHFVREIGINSILREAHNMLTGPSFIGQIHQKLQKTKPYLGSLNRLFLQNGEFIKHSTRKKPVYLVYDLTHDNQTYVQKKIQIVQTPLSFALSLIGTFTGSTKGYDQFYTHKIDVTQLSNLYSQDKRQTPTIDRSDIYSFLILSSSKTKCSIFGSWDGWKSEHPLTYHTQTQTYYTSLYLPPGVYEYKFKSEDKWFLEENKSTNHNQNHQFTIIHKQSTKQIYRNLEKMRQMTSKYTQKYFEFKQYFCFHIGNIVVVIRQPENHLKSICMIANLSTTAEVLTSPIQLTGNYSFADIWVQSQLAIYQGLTSESEISHSTNIHQFFEISINQNTGYDVLKAPFLPPGFACLLQCSKNKGQCQVIQSINQHIERDIQLPPLGPLELNALLFGCATQEENIYGQSNYSLPQRQNKQLVYGGFAGVYQLLMKAKRENNLNEGFFQNLRQGNWLLDYYINRLKRHKHMESVTEYLSGIFNTIGQLPKYLIPKYFTEFLYKFMQVLINQHLEAVDFEKHLVLASHQFLNYFPNCPLNFKILFAAGLPHFAVGWSRCWGRDTFTSVDILLISPNICRETILQFASTLRHGLIPNLLDEGRRPRYNCRDACWWFIRAICQYIKKTEDYDILKTKVEMIFLSNDILQHSQLHEAGKSKLLLVQDVIQQIFQSHVDGISFREWNAGYEIDSNMDTDGFNISLGVDFKTGFIIGGNTHNCLTWMDKMGSSFHAGTKGVPSTPRAGAPVELVGLLYYCLRQFQSLNNRGYYTFSSVNFKGEQITFSTWAGKVKSNFQPFFFVQKNLHNESVYIKGIYRDVVESPLKYDQNRFRPNALIALAVAPQLFDVEHARQYIQNVEKHLINPKSIGVSTLASNHTTFIPYYDNSDDSSNPKTAHGYSYHNGPEWVWLYGFYLTAKLNIEKSSLNKRKVMSLLQNHIKHLQNSEWFSLPQITNLNGEHNNFSCNAQAWSISSILMALKHIQSLPQ